MGLQIIVNSPIYKVYGNLLTERRKVSVCAYAADAVSVAGLASRDEVRIKNAYNGAKTHTAS